MLALVLAQAQQGSPAPQPGGGIGFFVPLIFIFLVWYLVAYRRREKRREQQRQILITNLKTSDGVVITTSQAKPDSTEEKYVCQKCGSSNIQSVPLLYEAGTSTSTSRGRVIGLAGLGTDHLTPAGGMTTT